jgi:mercuric ion transport protein
MKNKTLKFAVAAIGAAIATSLCCITPIFALLAGLGGIASSFSWLEPFRPYCIAITAIFLGIAFYQAYKPQKKECGEGESCSIEKKSFFYSKGFLWTITIFCIVILAFPYYSGIFISKPQQTKIIYVEKNKTVDVKFNVPSMECSACEGFINDALSKTKGVLEYKTSFNDRISIVKIDTSIVKIDSIVNAINSTGYKVEKYSIIKIKLR